MNIVSCDPEEAEYERGYRAAWAGRHPRHLGTGWFVPHSGVRCYDRLVATEALRCLVRRGDIAPVGCAADVPAPGCLMSEGIND